MIKVLIINPNSTDEITERIQREAGALSNDGLAIEVVSSRKGPEAIVTSYDEVRAAYYVLEELSRRSGEYDAAVIACASDPGLQAARELLTVPVTGIFESGAYACNMHGGRFSVIGSCDWADIPCFHEVARRYGLHDHLASVKYIDTGVCGVDMSALPLLDEKIEEAKLLDGASAVLLGCAAFAGFGAELSRKHGIYVTDGICEAVLAAKSMVKLEIVRRENHE